MTTRVRTRYDAVAISLHWLTAFLIIFMLVFGEDLMDRRYPDIMGATWHASIGAAILILSVLRLVWRLTSPAPLLPPTMKPWEVQLSRITHIIFYVMMIGLPITGWLAFSETVAKHPGFVGTSFFGLFPILQVPSAVDFPFDDLHGLGSNLMIALVALHVLAALKHQFMDDDNLLSRMIPLKWLE
jgi:cytochrome b561